MNVKVGDIIEFGSYWQNSSSYKEPIEWRVLDVKNSKALLISKYALDCQPYNEKFENVTWETCTLRRWLNSSFYNDAFSINERLKILDVVVTADANPFYDTDPGNNTKDKIFLLSIDEVGKYFSSIKTDPYGNWYIEYRMCAPTQYAINQGVRASDKYRVDGKATWYWWLRSPGNYSRSAACVDDGGRVDGDGGDVGYGRVGVRPALWINLENNEAVLSASNSTEESVSVSNEHNLEVKNIRTGDTISFGSYWQSFLEYKEPIEWRVLDVKDGKALLISRYALDCQPYNEEFKIVTWETCTLRKWLNSTFINSAFTLNEQEKIVTTAVTADVNPKYFANPGKDTQDKVFLLSINEVGKYFSPTIKTDPYGKCYIEFEDMMCAPTQYAINQDVWASDEYRVDGEADCCWWLRSLGEISYCATHVFINGLVDYRGSDVDFSHHGVRPALWINLEN